MRVILSLAVVFVSVLRADEVTDRDAIDSVIEGVNDPLRRARLFTKDVDSTVNFDSLIDMHSALPARVPVPIRTPEPWRILSQPHLVSGTIHFITPDVAVVDGASVVRGAVTFAETVPLLFVLKREQVWRINAVRRICSGSPANPAQQVDKPTVFEGRCHRGLLGLETTESQLAGLSPSRMCSCHFRRVPENATKCPLRLSEPNDYTSTVNVVSVRSTGR